MINDVNALAYVTGKNDLPVNDEFIEKMKRSDLSLVFERDYLYHQKVWNLKNKLTPKDRLADITLSWEEARFLPLFDFNSYSPGEQEVRKFLLDRLTSYLHTTHGLNEAGVLERTMLHFCSAPFFRILQSMRHTPGTLISATAIAESAEYGLAEFMNRLVTPSIQRTIFDFNGATNPDPHEIVKELRDLEGDVRRMSKEIFVLLGKSHERLFMILKALQTKPSEEMNAMFEQVPVSDEYTAMIVFHTLMVHQFDISRDIDFINLNIAEATPGYYALTIEQADAVALRLNGVCNEVLKKADFLLNMTGSFEKVINSAYEINPGVDINNDLQANVKIREELKSAIANLRTRIGGACTKYRKYLEEIRREDQIKHLTKLAIYNSKRTVRELVEIIVHNVIRGVRHVDGKLF